MKILGKILRAFIVAGEILCFVPVIISFIIFGAIILVQNTNILYSPITVEIVEFVGDETTPGERKEIIEESYYNIKYVINGEEKVSIEPIKINKLLSAGEKVELIHQNERFVNKVDIIAIVTAWFMIFATCMIIKFFLKTCRQVITASLDKEDYGVLYAVKRVFFSFIAMFFIFVWALTMIFLMFETKNVYTKDYIWVDTTIVDIIPLKETKKDGLISLYSLEYEYKDRYFKGTQKVSASGEIIGDTYARLINVKNGEVASEYIHDLTDSYLISLQALIIGIIFEFLGRYRRKKKFVKSTCVVTGESKKISYTNEEDILEDNLNEDNDGNNENKFDI